MRPEQLQKNVYYLVCGHCQIVQALNSIDEKDTVSARHLAKPENADHDLILTQKDILISSTYWNLAYLYLGVL